MAIIPNLDPLLLGLIVTVIANIIIISPVLWISGRLLAGKKAKFTHALWIVLIGTVIFYKKPSRIPAALAAG